MTQTIYGGKVGSELLLAGHVLNVTLDAGAGARLQRLYGGTVVESAALSASTTYGPYLHDMEFRLSALAGATVTIDTAAQTAQGLNAAKTAAADSLVSKDGTTGVWRQVPAAGPVMRVRMTGTGTVTMDSATGDLGAGTVTTAAYIATVAGTQIDDYAYPGDAARSIRFTLTGTAAVEVY